MRVGPVRFSTEPEAFVCLCRKTNKQTRFITSSDLLPHSPTTFAGKCQLASPPPPQSSASQPPRPPLSVMSRCLGIGNIKRVAQSIQRSLSSNDQRGVKHGWFIRIGICSSRYTYNAQYMSPARGHVSFTMYRTQRNFYTCHSAITTRSRILQYAHLVWARLSQRYTYGGQTSFAMNRIAQAVILGLNRSCLAVPGAFALMRGKNAALARAPQDTGFVNQSSNIICMRARDWHAPFTSALGSMVNGAALLFRVIYLAILFSPSIVMAPFADAFGPRYRRIWLHVVLRTLEMAGPAFIKWGQWAATRPDLFPRDLCTELSKLHTGAPEHSFAYTKKTIESAFGRKISEIFDEFEEKPVASGSIAQVHRASLRYRYSGKEIKLIEVAVKVRHPGVGESIKKDFQIINIVAKTSAFFPALRWLRLDESVQQFAVFMLSQVDLAKEAGNLSRFIYNFRLSKDVSFPKPVYPLVHPAVLVETFEKGESVAYYVDDLKGHEQLKSSLAHIGTHALLKMLLVDNFIHADMHPGNILVRVAKSKPSPRCIFKPTPHVVFLDVGMTAELSKSDKTNLIDLFKAVALRDGRTAAECTLRFSKKQNCPNPNAFIQEVKESFDFWGTPEGDAVHPAECMLQLLEQVRRHRVNIDGNVTTVMVTTLVLEGWQRKLDPHYDIMRTLQNLLSKADLAKSLSYTIEELMGP